MGTKTSSVLPEVRDAWEKRTETTITRQIERRRAIRVAKAESAYHRKRLKDTKGGTAALHFINWRMFLKSSDPEYITEEQP